MNDKDIDEDADDNDCDNDFGLRCPQCGESDELDVEALVWVRLLPNGTDADTSHDGSHQWDDDSACRCDACGWTGTVLAASPQE